MAYVAAPIVVEGDRVGVVSIGKPKTNIQRFIDTARRKLLLAVSPMSYFHKFEGKIKTSLVVYGKYDMTFLPELSRQVVDEFHRHKMKLQVAVLPCGHYTIGETPFKYLDAFYLSRFLASAF